MTDPRVSIVIATYNTGSFVAEALQSALAQTHANREIILVDDGSTDDTAARLEPFLSHIRYVRQENAGLAAARNHGLSLASGDYIALLDADDRWARRKLAIQLAIAHRRPMSGLIASDGVEFEGDKVVRRHLFPGHLVKALRASSKGEMTARFHKALIIGPMFACPAQTLIPRGVIESLGPFADTGAQDYDYYLRIAQRYPFTVHNHSLAAWRYRPDSMSGPATKRPFVWSLARLPVLGAHAARCETEAERRLVADAIDRIKRDFMSRVSALEKRAGRAPRPVAAGRRSPR